MTRASKPSGTSGLTSPGRGGGPPACSTATSPRGVGRVGHRAREHLEEDDA